MEVIDKINAIIKRRKKIDAELFFVDTIIVSSMGNIDIIKKKKFYGVSLNDEIIISPIYDEIVIITDSIVSMRIENRISLYDIIRKKPITEFDYTSLAQVGTYCKLNKNSDYFILYDTQNGKMFNIDGYYEEYNLKHLYTEYCWVRKGRFYDYIHRQSGKRISLPGIIMAYDTEFGMLGKDEFGKVSYFEETGVENNLKLRELVSQAGGYLTLINYTYNVEHIIDVYGNILNI